MLITLVTITIVWGIRASRAEKFATAEAERARAALNTSEAVTQFVRLGAFSFLAAGAFANKDILPYTIAEGHWAAPKALNKVGLKRAGLSEAERRNLDHAVRILLKRSLTVREALEKIGADCEADAHVRHLTRFVSSSKRGVARA